jgi:murein L,D-transpeptidase YafK
LANTKNTEVAVLASIKELKSKAKKFEKIISDLPLNKKTRQNFEKGKLLLSEANYDYGQKNYLVSKEKLTRADKHLKEAIYDVKVMLQSYFKSYSTWKKWHSETITHSRKNGQNAIVVDKMAKTCFVYKGGHLKHTFEIELGKNWIGNKRHQGDKTTPEGIYKVTKKLDSKNTIYHRALLINYPNEDDKKRFTSEKKKGALPRNANIGGLIEIHGDGGKGVNWTDGCVALHNDDMEVVYKLANVNTTVTIVGSLVDLSEIIDL